jgi:hypothetical protein
MRDTYLGTYLVKSPQGQKTSCCVGILSFTLRHIRLWQNWAHRRNMAASLVRQPLFSTLCSLAAIGAATYHLDRWHAHNLTEHEARMDELEGTLRGHIG